MNTTDDSTMQHPDAPSSMPPQAPNPERRARWPIYVAGALVVLTVADPAAYRYDVAYGQQSLAWVAAKIAALSLVALLLIARRWWWAAAVSVAVVVGLAGIAVVHADVALRGGVGDRHWQPTTDVQASYRLLAGDAELDLTQTRSRIIHTEVTVGAGSIRVVVPPSARVDIRASTGAGRVTVFGYTERGVNATRYVGTLDSGFGPELHINLRVGAGDVEVIRAAT